MTLSNLPYQIDFKMLDGYLKAEVSGPEDTFEISIQFWKDIKDKVDELAATRLMVVESFPNQLDAGQIYEVAKNLPILFPRIRLAHVDLNLSDMELNQMGETVAVNRGLVGKVFNDPSKAEVWLLED